jgi:glyoxylase-like metal-dependent hydrolase (beta-lactamase superfamily II)
MPNSDPVSAVSVISTGTVAIRPQHIATDGSPALWWALTERQWTPPLPISVYVIEHQDGLVLFDTGQRPDSLTDPDYFPRGPLRALYRRLGRAEIGPDETLTNQLSRIGYDISDVRTAVISHLHHDHAGGLAELRHAEIVVAEDEWKSMHDPLPATRGVFSRHIDLPGLRWRTVIPEATQDPRLSPFGAAHDLRGDGSLMILPTPGHTPGSVSLLVRRPKRPPLLMVGDMAFDLDCMAREQVPGVGKRTLLRDSTRKVNGLASRYPGLVVLPAHDPTAAGRLAAASPAAAD